MGLLGRGMRRALRRLDEDEVMVASVAGLEADGRRRRFVVVTGRRVLVGSARGDEPVELPLEGTTARLERSARLLTVACDGDEIVLRDVDAVAARALVEVLTHHRRPPEPGTPTTVAGVRVVRDPAAGTGGATDARSAS